MLFMRRKGDFRIILRKLLIILFYKKTLQKEEMLQEQVIIWDSHYLISKNYVCIMPEQETAVING